MLSQWVKSNKECDIDKVSKHHPSKYILSIKKKKRNSTLDKIDKHQLNEVIKVNITSKGANKNHINT